MMDHCDLPDPKPVDYITPSSAYSLSQCKLRAAYRSDPGYRGKTPSSQASRLGSACHEVLEEAGRGELPSSSSPEWRKAFDAKWDLAVRKQEKEASENPFERHWPPAAKWRNYSIRKIATRRLAEKVTATGTGATPAVEEEQQAFGGRLRGRADVIRRGEETEIEDYKTGSLFESGTEELKESYRTQMLLYAALEEAETGNVSGTSHADSSRRRSDLATDHFRAGSCRRRGSASRARCVQRGGRIRYLPAQELGSPGSESCRFCTYAVRCPRFWQSATSEWASEGVLAVAGEVQRREQAEHGSVGIQLEIASGSGGEGEAWIYGIDPERFYFAGNRGTRVRARCYWAFWDSGCDGVSDHRLVADRYPSAGRTLRDGLPRDAEQSESPADQRLVGGVIGGSGSWESDITGWRVVCGGRSART